MRLLLLQTGGVSKGRKVAQGQLIKIQLLATFRVQIDAAIEHVIGKGLENPSKITVVGLSHGGFFMTHLIGQEPDSFAAAAARNPVCNLGLMVGLRILRSSDSNLYMYADADLAGYPNDKISTSSYILFFEPNPVSWSSRKQRAVARSSTEAWVRNLLHELHITILKTPTIYCDNVGVIYLTTQCSIPI
ncbi:hypothetical protein FXO37_04286 [Capsicum annuum]|nr:hypothetical protein FXO37_04286 [Capsicum annuum]